MTIDETQKFTFVSKGLPEETFAVVRFEGAAGISKLYEYDITLAADDPDIDLKAILQHPAVLTLFGRDQEFPIHGILARFEQLQELKGRYIYRALLVPRLWVADQYKENQLFLDKTVPAIIEEILRQASLTSDDYELKLTRTYLPWEYICQYRETDFDFIARWMEREGIYYYFEQHEEGEKLIITDTSTAGQEVPGEAGVPFFPPSGLMPEEGAIQAFVCRQQRLPQTVILRDYNYRKPSLDLKAEMVVDPRGRGRVNFYGEHFKTPEEGLQLAKLRAEEILCRENIFHGESTAPNLCPGYLFELEDHYRQSYNQRYLIIDVQHRGQQTGAYWSGATDKDSNAEAKLTYANTFTAIPAGVQFRPERATLKPRFYGTLNATVDAAGDGQYAELDDQGRYKVKLPFDDSGRGDGKASRWVRMAQPYAGAEHGMHFPLHKGTEILLTFVDGDPDRPIIAGAVPNPETTSPVTADNQSESVIHTGGNNKIRLEDKLGTERIIMETPTSNTWARFGAPNDPATFTPRSGRRASRFIEDQDATNGIRIYTEGDYVEENEGTFVHRSKGTHKEYIKSGSQQSSKFMHTPDRGVYINGKNEVVANGDCVIRAQQGQSKEIVFELKNDKLKIDTGNRDFEINCNHFKLNNSDEDNITTGHDKAVHKGTSYESFDGYAEEHFFGDKLETHVGSSGAWYAGHQIEGFLGFSEELSLAQKFELYLGFKQEVALAHSLEVLLGGKDEICVADCFELFAGKKHEMDLGVTFEFEKGVGFKNSDVVFQKKVVDMVKEDIKMQDALLTLIG